MALSLCFCVIFALLQVSAGTASLKDKGTLRYDLLADYDKYVEPDGEDNGPIIVNHSIDIVRVISLENDVLTLQTWEIMKWKDSRLQWDLNKFNISSITMPNDDIWQPDILLVNSLEEYSGFPSDDLLATVSNDGTVTFVPPRVRKTACAFSKSALFENNNVTCSLMYMSWVRSLNVLDLRIAYQPDLENNDNKQWKVVDRSAARHVKKYPCCPEEYVDITYNIELKRIR